MRKYYRPIFALVLCSLAAASCQKKDKRNSPEFSIVGKWTVYWYSDFLSGETANLLPLVSIDRVMAPSKRYEDCLVENQLLAVTPHPSILTSKDLKINDATATSQDHSLVDPGAEQIHQLAANSDSQHKSKEVIIDFKKDNTAVVNDTFGNYQGAWSINGRELLLSVEDVTQIFEIISLKQEEASLLITFEELDQGVPNLVELQVLLKR